MTTQKTFAQINVKKPFLYPEVGVLKKEIGLLLTKKEVFSLSLYRQTETFGSEFRLRRDQTGNKKPEVGEKEARDIRKF